MLLIELVCLLKSNLTKTRLLSCNLWHYLLPPFFRVLFARLCFDDFLRLLLPLIFSPTYHLPNLCDPWKEKGAAPSRDGCWVTPQSPLSSSQSPFCCSGF